MFINEPAPQVWPEHPFETAANALANGAQVSISIHRGDDPWHELVLQGFDWDAKTIQVTDSNLDLSEDGLDTYKIDFSGPTQWQILDYASYGTVPIDAMTVAILPPVTEPEPAP